MSELKTLLISNACMVKDSNGNAAILYTDDFDKKMAALKPIPGSYDKPLWFSRDMIFIYDENLFRQVKEAYERHDKKLLDELWSQAKPWEPEEKSK